MPRYRPLANAPTLQRGRFPCRHLSGVKATPHPATTLSIAEWPPVVVNPMWLVRPCRGSQGGTVEMTDTVADA